MHNAWAHPILETLHLTAGAKNGVVSSTIPLALVYLFIYLLYIP
jgi:hypothetical protein